MKLNPEQIDHINTVNWFNFQFPELEPDFHHFANERKCSIQTGRLLKRMNVKRGVFDFFLALPINGKSGLWIELKVGKNKPTKEQIEFGNRKLDRGYGVAIAWGFDSAKEIILSYLEDYITIRANNDTKKLFNGSPVC